MESKKWVLLIFGSPVLFFVNTVSFPNIIFGLILQLASIGLYILMVFVGSNEEIHIIMIKTWIVAAVQILLFLIFGYFNLFRYYYEVFSPGSKGMGIITLLDYLAQLFVAAGITLFWMASKFSICIEKRTCKKKSD